MLPNILMVKDLAEKLYGKLMQAIDRQDRGLPKRVITVSAALPDELEDMQLSQKNVGTQRKIKRWIEQF